MPPLTIPRLRLLGAMVYTRDCRTKTLEGLKRISANAKEDKNILEQTLIQEIKLAGGKIISISGEADYKEHTYDFRIGYTEDCKTVNMGMVSIQNHSSDNVNLLETREFYLLLIDLFEKYFVMT